MNNNECEILNYDEPKSSKSEYISVIILFLVSITLLIYMIVNM